LTSTAEEHLPLNARARHLIDAESLSVLKQHASDV
jgi:hypothetical protein